MREYLYFDFVFFLFTLFLYLFLHAGLFQALSLAVPVDVMSGSLVRDCRGQFIYKEDKISKKHKKI